MLTPREIAGQAPFNGNDNLIINGDFQILQRTAATITGAETFIADRWKAAFAGGAVTPNRQTGGAGTRMDFVGGVATTYGWLRERLEKVVTERYTGGLTVTISCSVFSNNTVPRTISLSAQKPASGVADDWSLGGTNFVTGQAILLPSDSTFHRYSSTLTIAYADLQYGLGFGIEFVDGIGSGEVISITDYKVEIGNQATIFKKRQPEEELALCQRYYWKGQPSSAFSYRYGTGGAANYFGGGVHFPSEMRAIPTVTTVTAPSYQNCTLADIVVLQNYFDLRVNITATGNFRINGGIFEADAEL